MRLYEFDNPLRVSLIAVVGRLADQIADGKVSGEGWTVEKFLQYLKDNNIDELDRQDLFDIITNKKPPLSTYISNIKDGNIVWKGSKESPDAANEPEENKKIVKQMASKALK